MKFVDFTDNGRPDIYLANDNENDLGNVRGSHIYWHRDDGLDLVRPTELPTDHNMSGVVADFNRDGYLDLVTSGFGYAELVMFSGSDTGFGDAQRIPLVIEGKTYDQPRYMSTADLDGDGWLDLVIPDLGAHGGVIILWGGPDGFSNERATVLPSGKAVSTRVADLDADGWPDLVVGGFKGDDPTDDYRTYVYIYWGGPDGYSNHRRTELPAYFPVDVTVADFDNDGVLDIFATNYHGKRTRDMDSYLYWGAPGGNYSPDRMSRLFHHSGCGALAADFDEDGWTDLAVANHKTRGNHPGFSYVWWNGPSGFSPDRRTELPTAGPHGLTHTDLGNVMDRGAEEHFESRVHALPAPVQINSVSWDATVPAKTWIRAQVRCADTLGELGRAAWMGSDGPGSWLLENERVPSTLRGRYIQYRLAIGAFNSVNTPRITAVQIDYEEVV
nr:VCBS repeat-containing protein [Phytoactinopolyspora alkaliphila]